jgi:hypothetical protein
MDRVPRAQNLTITAPGDGFHARGRQGAFPE